MRRRRAWIACLLAAWASAAHAEKPRLFGVVFEPGFDYTVRRVEDRRSGTGAIAVTQWQHIEVADPAGGEPRELTLGVVYVAPQGVSNTSMQEAFDESTSEMAAKPGTRDTARIEIDGFPFHFIDGQLENPHLLRLGARAVDRAEYLARLAEALKEGTRAGSWESTPAS